MSKILPLLVMVLLGAITGVAQTNGPKPEDCKNFRQRDGRDALVCKFQISAQGWLISFLQMVKFDSSGTMEGYLWIFQTDDTVGNCGRVLNGNTVTDVISSSINRFELDNPNGNGKLRLLIKASLGAKLISQKEIEACNGARGEPDLYRRLRQLLNVPAEQYELEYRFDGATFVPTRKSKRTVKLFELIRSREFRYMER